MLLLGSISKDSTSVLLHRSPSYMIRSAESILFLVPTLLIHALALLMEHVRKRSKRLWIVWRQSQQIRTELKSEMLVMKLGAFGV